MIVAIHQLHYLPWIRYFHKIIAADVFVVLDDIQFNKNGWQNRNKIKHSNGWMYLTVPVYQNFKQNINEVQINNDINWTRKHWQGLITNYSKSKFFNRYSEFFYYVYGRYWKKLNDINYEIFFYLLEVLNIDTEIIKSSDLPKIEGEDSQRLVNICKQLNAHSYISGSYAAGVYLDPALFKKEAIEIVLQDWDCPEYEQLFPEAGFIPDLSIIDLLFNEGDRTLEIINKGGKLRNLY